MGVELEPKVAELRMMLTVLTNSGTDENDGNNKTDNDVRTCVD